MLQKSDLRSYQLEAISHMISHENAMLWLDMGLGKTITTLSAIVELMAQGKIKKTLIFGPVKVIESVWGEEVAKWQHTRHLKLSIMRGDEDERLRALFREADIYLINYENMAWLSGMFKRYFADKGKMHPFQCVVYDEVSKVKDSTSVRMHGSTIKKEAGDDVIVIKKHGWKSIIRSIPFRYGLTGTPASNGYIDLHGQYLAVDCGERLGQYITHFRSTYFTTDYTGRKYILSETNQKIIESKIADITLKMDAKDYLDMPPLTTTDYYVDLPEKVTAKYKQLEKTFFTELDSGAEIELFNSQSLSNKCLQFCNGNVYTDLLGNWEAVHSVKLDALSEILEMSGGNPILCSYTFKSDAQRIMTRFKKLNPVNLTEAKAKDTSKIIDKWNRGEIKLLIGHPASMGHGIDGLQQTGHTLVWFGINWSLELYNQMNGRLYRSGQTRPVSIIRILCKNTVDEVVRESIEMKDDSQKALKRAIEKYRNKHLIKKYDLRRYF